MPEIGHNIAHPGIELPVFTYNITRPYPYTWFSPTAIIGGIVLTALFSTLNFFATAYTMVPFTTQDPVKVEHGRWSSPLGRLFMSKTQPNCESAMVSIGSSYSTNHGLLSYQVTAAQVFPSDYDSSFYRTFPYHAQSFHDCTVDSLLVVFRTWYDRPVPQVNVSDWGITLQARVLCHAKGSKQSIFTDSLARYDMIDSSTTPIAYAFNGADIGYYWARSLLQAFYLETLIALANQTVQQSDAEGRSPQYNLSSGYVEIGLGQKPKEGAQGTRDENFFNRISWTFFDHSKGEKFMGSADTGFQTLIHDATWPNIWSPLDRLAKAMYNAVLIDHELSDQTSRDWAGYNEQSLRYWTANYSNIISQSAKNVRIEILGGPGELVAYGGRFSSSGRTHMDIGQARYAPATMAITYACQKPQPKSPLNIFISILVADLVLLRAAWSLYNLIVGYYLKDRHPESNVCDDCLARKGEDEVRAIAPVLPEITKMDNSDEHTIELDEFGPASPPAQQDDQQSLQSLLTHRRV